ncbi:MAG: hypothetical protein IPM64_01315 [Phycisphaerales bacterium]|nr:hypothetical protein [Phycisphaerales bacterium]
MFARFGFQCSPGTVVAAIGTLWLLAIPGTAMASSAWGEDTDGDGTDDHVYFDRDDDGNPEECWFGETNSHPWPRKIYKDTDDDGDWDEVQADDDNDGDLDGWRAIGPLDENPRPTTNPFGTLGDMNGDGFVNNFDIDPFVLAVIDRDLFELLVPDGNWYAADFGYNSIGSTPVNNFDIDPFVECIVAGNCYFHDWPN